MLEILLIGGPFHNTRRDIAERDLTPIRRFELQYLEELECIRHIEPKDLAADTLVVTYKQTSPYSLTYIYMHPEVHTMDKKELLNFIRVLEATISFMNAGITGAN